MDLDATMGRAPVESPSGCAGGARGPAVRVFTEEALRRLREGEEPPAAVGA